MTRARRPQFGPGVAVDAGVDVTATASKGQRLHWQCQSWGREGINNRARCSQSGQVVTRAWLPALWSRRTERTECSCRVAIQCSSAREAVRGLYNTIHILKFEERCTQGTAIPPPSATSQASLPQPRATLLAPASQLAFPPLSSTCVAVGSTESVRCLHASLLVRLRSCTTSICSSACTASTAAFEQRALLPSRRASAAVHRNVA